MPMNSRRDFLQFTAALGATLLSARALEAFAQAADVSPAALQALAKALSGTLLLPTDAAYAATAPLWNPRLSSHPAAIAQCRIPEDVAATILWSTRHGVPLALRSGGHCYEGFSTGPGLVIDTTPMCAIDLLPDKSVRIGAGARLLQVYEALAETGRSIPAGSCPTVGIAGFTLGGGYGLTSRSHGLAVDALVAVELVDAKGRTRRGTPHDEQHVLWACSGGGGGSFGVVTSFEFLPFAVEKVAVFDARWPFAKAADALRAWQSWAPHSDPNLTSLFAIREPAADLVYAAGVYLGSEERLKSILAGALPGTLSLRTQTVDYLEAVRIFAGGDAQRAPSFRAKSDFFRKPVPPAGIATVLDHMAKAPAHTACRLQFDAYGGAIDAVPRTATAFPHRDGTLFGAQYLAYWNRPELDAPASKWLWDFHEAMRPYVTGGAYVNYPDLDLKDYMKAYWGPNVPRLRRVKRRLDPGNVFHHRQSVT